jgi:FtsH-binding integral membrane protein
MSHLSPLQLIVGGEHRRAFGLDDYVFAALNVYLDIINLFMFTLQLLNDRW